MFYFCSRSNNVLFRKFGIMNTEFYPFVDDAKSIFGTIYCAVATRTLNGIICTFALHFLRAIVPQILNPTFNRRLAVLKQIGSNRFNRFTYSGGITLLVLTNALQRINHQRIVVEQKFKQILDARVAHSSFG